MSEASVLAWSRAWRERPPSRFSATCSEADDWSTPYRTALAKLASGARLVDADVRALVIGTVLDSGHLRGVVRPGADGSISVDGSDPGAPDSDHRKASKNLETSLFCLLYASGAVPSAAEASPVPPAFRLTRSGSTDAAGWPVVVAIVAASAVWCFAIYQASDVADRWNARNEQTKQLEQNHATAAAAAAAHVDREKEAGKPLPLDPATKTLLSNLGAEAEKLAARVDPPRSLISGELTTGAGFGAIGTLAAVIAALVFLGK